MKTLLLATAIALTSTAVSAQYVTNEYRGYSYQELFKQAYGTESPYYSQSHYDDATKKIFGENGYNHAAQLAFDALENESNNFTKITNEQLEIIQEAAAISNAAAMEAAEEARAVQEAAMHAIEQELLAQIQAEYDDYIANLPERNPTVVDPAIWEAEKQKIITLITDHAIFNGSYSVNIEELLISLGFTDEDLAEVGF